MNEAILILYLAGTGMTAKPVRVTFPTMEVCEANAERERRRGHKTFCQRRDWIRAFECANCNELEKPIPRG